MLDAKVKALNNKVAETCSNMADVIAYVDANMADMKDFIAEVAKKLPAPKRLEVSRSLHVVSVRCKALRLFLCNRLWVH